MRKLNARQKRILSKWVNSRFTRENRYNLYQQFFTWDYLDKGTQNKILNINDYETLIQDADRFLHDEFMMCRLTSRGLIFSI